MHRTGLRSASATSGTSRSNRGEPQDELAQRLAVDLRAAAEAVQQGGDALGSVDQLIRLRHRHWQHAERDGACKAGQAAAQADRHDRAEVGIPNGAHEHVRSGRRERLDDRARPRPSCASASVARARAKPLAPLPRRRGPGVRRRRQPRAPAEGSRPSARSGRRSPAATPTAHSTSAQWWDSTVAMPWVATRAAPSAVPQPARAVSIESRCNQRARRRRIEIVVAGLPAQWPGEPLLAARRHVPARRRRTPGTGSWACPRVRRPEGGRRRSPRTPPRASAAPPPASEMASKTAGGSPRARST